jgi:hypothetical protein
MARSLRRSWRRGLTRSELASASLTEAVAAGIAGVRYEHRRPGALVHEGAGHFAAFTKSDDFLRELVARLRPLAERQARVAKLAAAAPTRQSE